METRLPKFLVYRTPLLRVRSVQDEEVFVLV